MNNFFKPPLGSQIDPQHPLSQGCVMALLMLEGSGNRTYDLTHNGNDGVLTNGPLWKPGRNGTAISFDGVDDYAETRKNIGIAGNQSRTIAVWFKPTNSLTKNVLGFGISSNGRVFDILLHNGQFIGHFQGSGFDTASGAPFYNVGKWNFGVFTYDGATVISYLNGAYGNQKALLLNTGTSSLTIGGGIFSVFNYFNGLISDTRIWNRALSAQEVQDLYINPYGFIWEPQKYWLMPQGVTIPPHLFRRAA